MNIIRYSFLILLMVGIVPTIFMNSKAVEAQASVVCDGLTSATGNDCGQDPSDSGGIDNAIKTTLNILSMIAGVAAVFMIMYAGIKFITSQGDSSGVASARNSILYAIIGIIIVVMSQTIVYFVLNSTTPPDNANATANCEPGTPCENNIVSAIPLWYKY